MENTTQAITPETVESVLSSLKEQCNGFHGWSFNARTGSNGETLAITLDYTVTSRAYAITEALGFNEYLRQCSDVDLEGVAQSHDWTDCDDIASEGIKDQNEPHATATDLGDGSQWLVQVNLPLETTTLEHVQAVIDAHHCKVNEAFWSSADYDRVLVACARCDWNDWGKRTLSDFLTSHSFFDELEDATDKGDHILEVILDLLSLPEIFERKVIKGNQNDPDFLVSYGQRDTVWREVYTVLGCTVWHRVATEDKEMIRYLCDMVWPLYRAYRKSHDTERCQD